MSNLVTVEANSMQLHHQPEWVGQIVLMKEQLCKKFSNQEFEYFCSVSKSLGLNPLAREIFAVPRWDKDLGREVMSIQISIDGQRSVAERTGLYQGQQAPLWCGEDGQWVDVWLKKTPPAAAKVGVLRKDFKEPLIRIALWSEFCQTKKDGSPAGLWAKMPALMLAKCAESQALRAAFPSKLAGLYTQDEMAQSTPVEPEPEIEPAPVPQIPTQGISLDQRKRMFAIAKECGVSEEQIKATLQDAFGITSTKELTQNDYQSLIAWIQSQNPGPIPDGDPEADEPIQF